MTKEDKTLQILNGKLLSEEILNEIKSKLKNYDKKPSLAVILANDSAASKIYVNKKEQVAKELGFDSNIFRFDESVSQDEMINLIRKLNSDPNINGILVQLPLFKHLDENQILETIDPKKDVDGFHPINTGKLFLGLEPYAIPCTPKGIIRLLKKYFINGITGKNAIVIGRSNIVGKPMAALLLKENATVTIAHSKTKDLEKITKEQDIIISAAGKKGLVTKNMVRAGSVIIDVGILKDENNKLRGDVEFDEVKDIAAAITPVPGGVGPMTIAMLMENTLELFIKQQEG